MSESDRLLGAGRCREPIWPHQGLECLVDLGPGGCLVILAQLIQELHERRLCLLQIAHGVRQRLESVDEVHRPNVHDHGFNGRLPGRRVKHRMKRNWIKMYEKAGWILRNRRG